MTLLLPIQSKVVFHSVLRGKRADRSGPFLPVVVGAGLLSVPVLAMRLKVQVVGKRLRYDDVVAVVDVVGQVEGVDAGQGGSSGCCRCVARGQAEKVFCCCCGCSRGVVGRVEQRDW
jgi:hypothetical protein